MADASGTAGRRRAAAWAGFLGAAAAGAAAIALVRWAGPPIYCGDGYFHIRFARLILEEGISRTFPWFQESFQRDAYTNFNLLYHVFLMPFTFLKDLTTAARVAAVAGGTATVVAFWWSLRSLEVRAPLLWTLLLLGAAPEYLFRLTFTRPLVLSLGLASLGTVAILKGKMRWAAAAAAVWAHLHSSLHLLPAVALAHDALREAPGETCLRRFRTAAWTLGGAAAGLLVSPFFPNDLRFWAVANLGVLRHAWERGDEARVATELAAMPSDVFLLANAGPAAAMLLAVVLLAGGRRLTDQARTLLVVASGFLGLSLVSQRFAEHWAPYSILLLAVAARDAELDDFAGVPALLRGAARTVAGSKALRRIATALAFAAALALLGWSVSANRRAAAAETAEDYGPVSRWMAEHVPHGDTLFHPGYDEFGPLFFHDTGRRFLIGLDPAYFRATDETRFRLWGRIARGELADVWEPIRKTFGCRWVFLPARFVSLRRILERDPRFERVYGDREASVYAVADDPGYVGDWTVRGPFPDPRRSLWTEGMPAGGDRGKTVRVSGFLDFRSILGIPASVQDVCAVAETTLDAPAGSRLEIAVTSDDAVRVIAGSSVLIERSPWLDPPPGTPGGPALDLAALGSRRRAAPTYRAEIAGAGDRILLRVESCAKGGDFGFFLQESEHRGQLPI